MQNYFAALEKLPPDPLLNLMRLAQADTRPEKIDVGVGVYKDAGGKTPVLQAVREAERRMVDSQQTKVYEGPRGNINFCAAIEEICLGEGLRHDRGNRIISYTTPGGCGGLSAGMGVVKKAVPDATVWLSTPTWGNYHNVIKAVGLKAASHRYLDTATQKLDFDGMCTDLEGAKAGDVLLIQGSCHNPSGLDMTPAQWEALAGLCNRRGIIPFIDVAYHGFARSLEEDMAEVQKFIFKTETFFLAYSCSKNFSLYRERTGCLIIGAPDAIGCERASQHMSHITRSGYSMPPAHGAAIVQTILADADLKAMWISELDRMRGQIIAARAEFQRAATALAPDRDFDFITRQNGMFSMLPLKENAAEILRETSAVYMPSSGRINFAALNDANVGRFAEILMGYLSYE